MTLPATVGIVGVREAPVDRAFSLAPGSATSVLADACVIGSGPADSSGAEGTLGSLDVWVSGTG